MSAIVRTFALKEGASATCRYPGGSRRLLQKHQVADDIDG